MLLVVLLVLGKDFRNGIEVDVEVKTLSSSGKFKCHFLLKIALAVEKRVIAILNMGPFPASFSVFSSIDTILQ